MNSTDKHSGNGPDPRKDRPGPTGEIYVPPVEALLSNYQVDFESTCFSSSHSGTG